MQSTQDILDVIARDNETIISNMLHDLIDEHSMGEGRLQSTLYNRYKQERTGVPIFAKKFANYEKAHERIPNDFFGDIIDLKTGYMGNEIVIEIDERKVTQEAELDRQNVFLQTFGQREGTGDKNSELVKMAAITGKAFRLLYIAARDGQAHVMNVDPWEAIVFYDASLNEPEAAMRYYRVEDVRYGDKITDTQKSKRWRVEWYDRDRVTYYQENDSGHFVIDVETEGTDGTGRQAHLFSGVPLVEFKNNEEGQSEAHKVLELIDAYDNILSDTASEIEQLRMAYMFARGLGMKLDPELEAFLEQTGIWPLPQTGEVGFINKDLGGAAPFVQQVLDELRRNIYSFAKSIDLSVDKGGDMRVIGWQIALLRLEMSAQVTERKFKRAYVKQYGLLSEFWRRAAAIAIDPYSMRFVFTRKFPKDIDQEIETLIKAIEALPLEEAYGLMTFIDNPQEIAEKFRDERPDFGGVMRAMENAESELGRPGPVGTPGSR